LPKIQHTEHGFWILHPVTAWPFPMIRSYVGTMTFIIIIHSITQLSGYYAPEPEWV